MDHQRVTSRRVSDGSAVSIVFRAALFLFILSIVVLEFPGAREVLETPYAGISTRNLMIQAVDAEGPNADLDLLPGDRIVSVDGERLRNHLHYAWVLSTNTTMEPQRYRLDRSGRAVEALVTYEVLPRSAATDRFAFLLVAFSFLMVGLWVYMRRPDRLGSTFAAVCVMLAFFLTDRPSPGSPALQLAGELIYDAVILAFPAALVHFFVLFPGRGRTDVHTVRRRLRLMYTVPLLLYMAGAWVSVNRFMLRPVNTTLVDIVLAMSTVYFGGYLVLSLGLFVRRYRRSRPALKQRLRVVIAGTVAGFVPLLAVTVLHNLAPGLGGVNRFEIVAALCLGFIPITYAYAILKHGAIELNLVVRRSLVYAFLTGAIVAGYYALVNVVSDVMVRELGAPDFVWGPLTILFLALMFAPARERIQRIVDRIFYREEFTYKEEVSDLGRQLASRVTRAEILDYFCDRVDALLSPTWIAIYRGNGAEALELETTRGAPPELRETFQTQSFLARYLTRFRTPLMVEYLDRYWERPHVDDESRRFLTLEDLSVCLPLVDSDGLSGLVLLGSKRSQMPYRRAEGEVIGTFGEQLALVLHNAALIESSLEQERLQNEVMVARDIQLSLLPDRPPAWPGLEVQGQMVSSFEMGGDYFDYFPVDPTRLAVCIGDVSGKGIPAAMLMSSLRAVFKNAALKRKLPPADLNAELNDYLYENAKPEQFATFFYGVFDRESGTLSFSNAGQCPALLVREEFVDRLGEGRAGAGGPGLAGVPGGPGAGGAGRPARALHRRHHRAEERRGRGIRGGAPDPVPADAQKPSASATPGGAPGGRDRLRGGLPAGRYHHRNCLPQSRLGFLILTSDAPAGITARIMLHPGSETHPQARDGLDPITSHKGVPTMRNDLFDLLWWLRRR